MVGTTLAMCITNVWHEDVLPEVLKNGLAVKYLPVPFSSHLQHSHKFLKMAEARGSVFVPSLEVSSSPTSNSG